MLEITEGSMAVAEAVRLCRPQVVAAYPITPQTHIVEALAEMVANGKLDADYITVESEFSALSACLGASAAGSRTYSATTSQGLALMFEVCFNVAGMRLPIIMTIANRALGAPLSIWNDQQDSISLRDSGWLQFYAEDNQEATDLHYIAYRVAENPAVQLPAFVCFDGFILSHTYEPVDMLTQGDVDRYLPKFAPTERLDAADPVSFGMYATPSTTLSSGTRPTRRSKRQNLRSTRPGKSSGRFSAGTTARWSRGTSLRMRRPSSSRWVRSAARSRIPLTTCGQKERKSGLLKIRVFRPFPSEDVAKALKGAKHVAVLDKNISLGAKGAVALEVKDALYGSGIPVFDYIIGLGGRDVRKKDIREVVALAEKGKGDQFIGLRKEVL